MILLHPNVQAFLTVNELSTISAAAKKLNLTQTAMTQRIKSLERDVGVALFTRSRLGMKLTAEGHRFFRACIEAKGLETHLSKELKITGSGVSADLMLVGPMSVMSGRIVDQVQGALQRWPLLNIRLSVEANADRVGLIKKGVADLAIIPSYEVPAEFDSKVLKPLEYVFVTSADWKKRSITDILQKEKMIALHPADVSGSEYLQKYDLLKDWNRSRIYVNDSHAQYTMLIKGFGFGVLVRELAAPFAESGKLAIFNGGKSLKIDIALTWYPRKQMPEYFRDFVKAVK